MISRDTIAAISTAVSESGIGIVRVSGEKAIEIVDSICLLKSGRSLCDCPSHTIHYGYIKDPGHPDSLIDEVLISVFKAPRSYTAEDTAEINCHGGVYAMKRILEAVLDAGARAADPGEFTKRAFLNGRIDLSQAEAVMDIITAKNDLALKNSVRQVRGRLGQKIDECRKEILYETAVIESALDDPEHYSLDGFSSHLEEKLKDWEDTLEALVRSAETGRIMQEGIKTAIVGKPNVGKSSLLNALTGEESAIVTDIEGTTRDVLSQNVSFGEFTLQLMDTAGIRKTDDIVETIGVERAIRAADQADLILWIIDSSRQLDGNDLAIFDRIKDRRVIILLNKTDLLPAVTEAELVSLTKHRPSSPVISICASTGEGLDELESMIRQMFYHGQIRFNDEVIVTSIRQKKLLEEALAYLHNVRESLQLDLPEDFYSIDLTGAYKALGAVIGRETGEDLVNEIFEKFCMGK